jgi:hypothetical protein
MAGALYADPINSISNSAQPSGQGATYSAIYDPALWAAEGIRARTPVKLMVQYAKHYEDANHGYGSLINIQTINNMVANAKVDQTQVTLQQPVGSNKVLNINRYYEASFLVELVQSEQSRLSLQEEYTPKSAEIIERKKDIDMTSLVTSASASVIGTNTTPLTDANLIAGITTLNAANVPMDGRHLVVAPSTMGDLYGINKYLGVVVGADTTAPGSAMTKPIVETGLFGKIYGIPVNMTTDVIPGASSTGSQNLLFHESAFGIAEQIDTTTKQDWFQAYLGWMTTSYGLWGTVCLRPDHVINITTH